jgi:DNA replication protein DnaC
MSKTEVTKISNNEIVKKTDEIQFTEIQLKKRFLRLIQQSFYENPENNRKTFIIDKSNLKAIKLCFEWALIKENRRKGIFLYGDYGTGKSSIIEGLYKFYTELHYSKEDEIYRPLYRTAVRITTFFKDENEYWINRCKYCPVLFIPEIGREAERIFDRKPIEEVLTERYDNKRTIVASCNDIKQLPYGEYIYERIYQMCEVIRIEGKSKR